MQINQTTSEPATVLSLTGDLDSFSSNYLKEHISRLFDEGTYKIIIDLHEVGFVDSAGLGQLVGALKMCFHHGGNLVLVGANEAVTDLLHLTKLDTVFKVFDTVEDAVEAVFSQ